MKKILLFASMASVLSVNAQIFSEDFANGIPSTFTLIDNDGLTPAQNVSFVNDAWVENNGNATSTSWYSPAGTSDDWMITPGISVASAGTFLLWDAVAQDASYPDGYEVKISTTGNTMADFTSPAVFSTAGENPSWTTRNVNLDAYMGQTIYVAFINNSNDQFLLRVDNILVDVFTGNDLKGESSPIKPFAAKGGNVDISAMFTNKGGVVTAADFNYSVNGGATVTQNLTGINWGPNQAISLTHATAWSPSANGSYTIEMWIDNINGNADDNPADDKVSVTVEVADPVTRYMLAEEFSSSTCPPCASWNTNVYNAAHANYNKSGQNKLIVKYQVPIPVAGDPSHNADGDARRAYYNVNSAPSMLINGSLLNYTGSTWADAANEYTQFENDGLAEPAFVNISATADFTTTSSTGDVAVSVNVSPNIDMTSDYALQISVLQRDYVFNGATNGDFNYHHVMRKMLPNPNGTTLNVAAGATQTINETYNFNVVSDPAAGSFDLWNHNIEIVAYVEQVSSKTIMNASLANIQLIGLDEELDAKSFDLYPNPARDIINIEVEDANSDVTVELVNSIGQVVYNKNFADEKIQISTSNLDRGLYIINVTQNGVTTSSRLSLVD